MSLIPSNAISIASTIAGAQTNEAIRARRVQTQKNDHHAEDVQELDDTAVDSVGDEKQDRHQQGESQPKEQGQNSEELVDIATLKELPLFPGAPVPPETPTSHLDISA